MIKFVLLFTIVIVQIIWAGYNAGHSYDDMCKYAYFWTAEEPNIRLVAKGDHRKLF